MKKIKIFGCGLLMVLALAGAPHLTSATSASSLQQRIDELNAKIAANNEVLEGIEHQADTLQNKVNGLNAEISQLNNSIDLTSLQIKQTQDRINDAIERLEQQKKIMFENAKTLYKIGNPTTIEILASSDSFSDFVNRQEYLESVKDAVNKAATEIIALKEELEAKQAELKDFVQSQQAAKKLIEFKRNEQAELLAQTRGQEARYQARINGLKEERASAENQLAAQLAAYLNGNGNFTTYGSVGRGDRIGSVGSTGYSFGPHLHFSIFTGSGFVNPYAGSGTIIRGYSWPVPATHSVSQHYGCQSQIVYATSCGGGSWLHNGMDISNGSYGSAVIAVAGGEIIWRGDAGDGYGFSVIIDHGDGYLSRYGHMIPE